MTEYTQQEEKVFTYLDNLRESGVTNMFGCKPYVQNEFPVIPTKEVDKLVSKWMSTFEERHPED